MEWKPEPKLEELVQINPERSRVLSGLIEARGSRDVGKFIVAAALGGGVRRIVNSGEPMLGKTSLLFQEAVEIDSNARLLGIARPIIITQYDEFLTGDKRWDDSQAFNEEMMEEIYRREAKNPDALHLIEVPAVGFTPDTLPAGYQLQYNADFIKDRGVSAFNALVRYSLEDGNDGLFVRLLRDKSVQDRTARLRQYITSLVDDNDVLSELASLNAVIKGVSAGELGGAEIKALMKKMANEQQTKVIKDEEDSLALSWSTDNFVEESEREQRFNDFPVNVENIIKNYRDFGIDVSDEMRLQAEYEARTSKDSTKRQAAYVEAMFERMGLDRDRGLLIYNTYNPGNIEIDFSRTRRAA